MSPSPTGFASSTRSPLSLLADRLDPPERDVFGLLGYTPTDRQQVFHEADEFDVLYGGAAGGGKTKALLMDGLRDADRYPGLRIGAFRRTYDELAESFFKELTLIDFARDLGCRWIGNERELRFPNGSVIRFRYLESIKDATRRQGGEYQKVLIDERTLISPEAVSIVVDERIRSGRRDIPVLGIRSGTNPGGPGHGTCKRRYVDATGYGRQTYCDEQGRTVRFVPAKVDDNPHVDAGYKARLDAISDPARRAAMKDGSWDSFAGQFFSEWNRDLHVVRPFTVPPTWERRAGIDWGYAHAWAVVWIAYHERRAWVYRQVYETGVLERDQAQRILRAERGESLRMRLADPSMWQNRNHAGVAHSLAHSYIAEGCTITKADNDRVVGWQRLHSYLDMGPACDLHRKAGLEECPLLHVFETCEELIHAIPNAPRDPDKPEDVDTDFDHDHDLDALRYVLMSLPVPPPRKPPKPEPTTPEERLVAHIRKRRRPKTGPQLVGT